MLLAVGRGAAPVVQPQLFTPRIGSDVMHASCPSRGTSRELEPDRDGQPQESAAAA